GISHFFFSSRRRHTRSKRDWSSDVCSSDLTPTMRRCAWADRVKAFQLQRRIVGVEVAAGAFFNGKEFVLPVNINFEHKKLFPGRSEERRVGKAGISAWWADAVSKKKM